MRSWRNGCGQPLPLRDLLHRRLNRGDPGGLLGLNEVEAMNQALQFGTLQVDGPSLADVCRRYGVKELSLFGSVVRGEMRPESDIDIMVEFQPGERIGCTRHLCGMSFLNHSISVIDNNF